MTKLINYIKFLKTNRPESANHWVNYYNQFKRYKKAHVNNYKDISVLLKMGFIVEYNRGGFPQYTAYEGE